MLPQLLVHLQYRALLIMHYAPTYCVPAWLQYSQSCSLQSPSHQESAKRTKRMFIIVLAVQQHVILA